MTIDIIDPKTKQPIRDLEEVSVRGVPRFCEADNYSESFGMQWNKFDRTQLDEGLSQSSAVRFFAATSWNKDELAGQNVLEVGSGAGRFSRAVLENTRANLYSVDYSSAVEANLKNNGQIAPERFHLFQASIYEMPFPDGSFDKVFCLGVLQHTPDFEASVRALIRKARIGGEIVVDFYPIRGWWTKVHAKYILRPFTKRLSHDRLLSLIEKNAGWMMSLYRGLTKIGLHPLTRFVPICDIRDTLPAGIGPQDLREWVVLDTFDMLSPEHDHPQRIKDVAAMFARSGAEVTFADFIDVGYGRSAIVRGVRKV